MTAAGTMVKNALAMVNAMETLLIQAQVESDRREEPRLAFLHDVEISWDGIEPFMGFTRDISMMGIGLLHQQKPPELISLRIFLGEGQELRLGMRVRWCEELRNGWFATGGDLLGVVE
ncbi:PilZ domain-containing protein [Lignipirellula cremea]|uniref:PilZ domain-containing protein n=1 Tax=Lignipirellula cremea TaxID=2528010 RepID=A0A518DT68_9BACT|nr:PilZ domain-containing protein [Lignipirellula cremea]QDU95030.1 hypothetical protein Pla8534_28410 [Lignipirellula cremea]